MILAIAGVEIGSYQMVATETAKEAVAVANQQIE